MAYWNSSETSITLSGLKRNGMSRSNVGGLVAFSKVFRSDRLTNLIPGYTIPVCLQFLHPLRLTDPQMFPFSRLSVRFSPLPPLFFPPSFLARVCTKRENFKLEKPRSENKGRDDAWEEENKDPLLFPSPAALLHSRCSPLCDETEVSRYKIRRGRGGRRRGGRR